MKKVLGMMAMAAALAGLAAPAAMARDRDDFRRDDRDRVVRYFDRDHYVYRSAYDRWCR
jgi:hypothetical protein